MGEPKFCEKGGDNMVNDFNKKNIKIIYIMYTYKSIYTFVSSNFEARATLLFFNMPFNGLFYIFIKKVIVDR